MATLATGSSRVPVVLRNNTKDWLEIKKCTPIASMVAANLVPRVINAVSAKGPDPASTLTEAERQDLLLDKLDLSGLDAWPKEQAEKACGLLKEYHDIFFLEKQDMGHTKVAEHKIVLKDPGYPSIQGAVPQDSSSTIGRGERAPEANARCRRDPTKQQPMVQCCCLGKKERRVTPLLH